MNIEEARELCKEEFMKNVMANLDSTLIFTYISNLEKENQQLKKENKILRENAEHNDKVVDKVNWENLKLKKELEEYKRLGFEHLSDKCNKLENHQKEFIEWLTNEININSYDISDYIYDNIINAIISKYEEIIDK